MNTARLARCVTQFTLLVLLTMTRAGSGRAESGDPPAHTFSIAAFDPESGDLGVAVASKVLGVGSIVPFAEAGVGAIATQSRANTAYGPEGLALLKSGRSAAETLSLLTGADNDRDHRQLGIVDAEGNAATFTGAKCIDWAGHVQRGHFVVQGNLLTSEKVVEQMAAAFEEAAHGGNGELADWMMAALASGEAAGGDKRGKQSAALLVVRRGAGYGGNDRYIDLRVEDQEKPVDELARLLVLHKQVFAWHHNHKPHRDDNQKCYPPPKEGDYVISDFEFQSGQVLPELRMHFMTLGEPRRDDQGKIQNAVLILHGTTGSSQQFLRPEFAEELYGKGQPLDASRYFLVIPDNVGHGKSSKPSDGLRGKFPHYGYRDMIEAQRRLLVDGLGIDHVRLVIGTSMGGMHIWLWGQLHPEFMDALMPLGCLPTQISGRNRPWRRLIIDAIRNSPDWNDGDYESQPSGLRSAVQMSYLMSSNPVLRLDEAATLAAADEALDKYVEDRLKQLDANDMMYAFAASHDYDPGPGLANIKVELLAINSADDLINPPELGVLEREIQRVPRGRAIVLPRSELTRGHGSHTVAALWKHELAALLQRTEKAEIVTDPNGH